ncbi:MAG: glycerophosphodiester phosphodiesterase [Bacteroidetes bacterium]|nr:glycerophosphodiester phosphodiesterase [Bacteroidota bacterium]HET6243344.1 glycerophosphodiester phosphodiesterase family protein [Bacteroidia bacterium]
MREDLKRIMVIAHRGSSAIAPENTISAFKQAVIEGSDIIELDVHQSKDGVVLCIHDEELSRTTTGKGKVINFTFEELKLFDAGVKFSQKFKGETIPSLEQVLEEIKLPILIEIKNATGYYPEIEQNIINLLKKHNSINRCIIQSFENSILFKIRELNDQVELHKLVLGNLPIVPFHIDNKLKRGEITEYSNVKAINPNHKFLSKNLVDQIHKNGQKVFTWTVDDESDMIKVIGFGVDGIITNYPDRLLNLL